MFTTLQRWAGLRGAGGARAGHPERMGDWGRGWLLCWQLAGTTLTWHCCAVYMLSTVVQWSHKYQVLVTTGQVDPCWQLTARSIHVTPAVLQCNVPVLVLVLWHAVCVHRPMSTAEYKGIHLCILLSTCTPHPIGETGAQAFCCAYRFIIHQCGGSQTNSPAEPAALTQV